MKPVDYVKNSPSLVVALDTSLTTFAQDLLKVQDLHKLTIPLHVKCITIAVSQYLGLTVTLSLTIFNLQCHFTKL